MRPGTPGHSWRGNCRSSGNGCGSLQKRFDAGEISRPDLLLTQILLTRTHLDLREARQRAVKARARLAAAIGLSPAALDGARYSFETLEQLPLAETLPLEETQREALLGARLEVASSQLFRLKAPVEAQRPLGRLEDALQRPLLAAGAPVCPSAIENDPRPGNQP